MSVMCVHYYVCVDVKTHIPRHTCGDQRTTLWDRFSPFFFMWIQALNSGHQACEARAFTPEPISLDSVICFYLFVLLL